MGKKDLTEMLGGGGGRTRQKYKCRLADVNSGSAVKTYRQLQIEKAHLPIELWESDVFGPESDPNP